MIGYIQAIFAFLVALIQMIAPLDSILYNRGVDNYFDYWDADMVYTEDYAIELEKQNGEDFVILNLTDIQLSFGEEFNNAGKLAKATIKKLVEETEPDLITVTGDNAWSLDAYEDMISMIDGYGIPWAPVMGNHDGQGCISELWCAARFEEAENCLFKIGPQDMGYGNYIINVTENGNIIHTMFMMDTHSNVTEDNINGTKEDGGYDHLWENQLKWYEWAVNGTTALAGHTVPSSVFFHIPVVEYKDAWDAAYDKDAKCFREEYAETSFGVNHEGVASARANNGFFDLCKKLGSTKDIICGHDHVNTSSIVYDGIRLTYALKTGSGCYWEQEMSGGTKLTVDSNGIMTTEHVYINPTQFGIDLTNLG